MSEEKGEDLFIKAMDLITKEIINANDGIAVERVKTKLRLYESHLDELMGYVRKLRHDLDNIKP